MSALLQAEQALAEGRLVDAAKLVAEAFAANRGTAAELADLDVYSSIADVEAYAFVRIASTTGARLIFEATPTPPARVVEIMAQQVGRALEAVTDLAMVKLISRLTADEGDGPPPDYDINLAGLSGGPVQ